MKNIYILFSIVTFFIFQKEYAQKIKFGKVSKAELAEKYYPLDSSANAAILYKKRRTYFEFNGQEGWLLITKVHERIKIYNKKGYHWATKQIKLYQGGNGKESVSIKAYTFNLNNDKVERIKLKGNQIFSEEVNKYWRRKKFTMPTLTEGCVIEWEYTITSSYFSNIDDMVFQYKIPVKYIDTQVRIPEYFVFAYRPSTYYPVKIIEGSKNRTINFSYRSNDNDYRGAKTTSHSVKVDLVEKTYKSIEKNIPALKDEPYTNNINNYKSKTSFELTAYKPKNGIPKFYNTTWEDVTKTIYKSQNFGGQLEKSNFYEKDLQGLVNKTSPLNEKIVKIFQFVKSKIVWDGFYGKYTSKGVKKAYKEGTGNAAEINLLLISMLRKVGVNANPVLISTRAHGISLFPTSDGFNYVIAGVEVENNVILLDATEKYSIPNVLPLRDLNWRGRIVRKSGSSTFINLLPKKHAKRTYFVNATIDGEGTLTGVERVSYTNLRALQMRTKYNQTSEESMIAIIEKNNQNIEIDQLKITHKENIGKPLLYQFGFETEDQVEVIGDKMYFSPLLFLSESENPFKLEDRKFPVDYGAPWENKYTISIKIPEGYTIEHTPKNEAFTLPENLGVYKLITAVNGNKIQILSNVKINFPIIPPNYYSALKEFYKQMINKQLDKIVLVKK